MGGRDGGRVRWMEGGMEGWRDGGREGGREGEGREKEGDERRGRRERGRRRKEIKEWERRRKGKRAVKINYIFRAVGSYLNGVGLPGEGDRGILVAAEQLPLPCCSTIFLHFVSLA